MQTIQATIIVAGDSPSVLELADGKLDGHVKQRDSVGSTGLNGEPVDRNFVIVEIPLDSNNDESALETVEKWLIRNRNSLTECDGNKTLEFQTYLESDVGSLILTIPNSLIQIAADLKLNVANQAIRLLTEDERNGLRG